MSLRNISVSARTSISFGFLFLVLLAVGLLSLQKINSMKEDAQELEENWLASIAALSKISINVYEIRVHTLRMFITDDHDEKLSNIDDINEHKQAYKEEMAVYTQLVSSSDERAMYVKLQELESSYEKAQGRVMASIAAKQAPTDQDIE